MNFSKENAAKMRTRQQDIGKRRNTTNSISKKSKSRKGKENESNCKRKLDKIVHLEPIGKTKRIINDNLVYSSNDDEGSIQPDNFDNFIDDQINDEGSIQPDKFDDGEDDQGKDGLEEVSEPLLPTNRLHSNFVVKIVKVEEDDKQSLNENAKSIASKDKTRALGSNTICMLHAYVRDILFRQRKIIDVKGSDLDTNGLIMVTLLKHLNFSVQTGVNNTAFLNECKGEIMKTINARRNYVKKQLSIMMTGK